MDIFSTKNQVGTIQMDLAASDDPGDPYDIDLVIRLDLRDYNSTPTYPSGGDGGDYGGGGGGGTGNVC